MRGRSSRDSHPNRTNQASLALACLLLLFCTISPIYSYWYVTNEVLAATRSSHSGTPLDDPGRGPYVAAAERSDVWRVSTTTRVRQLIGVVDGSAEKLQRLMRTLTEARESGDTLKALRVKRLRSASNARLLRRTARLMTEVETILTDNVHITDKSFAGAPAHATFLSRRDRVAVLQNPGSV